MRVNCLFGILMLAAAGAVAAPSSPSGFDLAKKDEYFASLKAKIDEAETKPLDRRNAAYQLVMGEMLVCEDAELPAKEAELMKLITERGDLPATDYVTFLYKTVHRNNYGHPRFLQYQYVEPDVDALGFKATADDPAARRLYYALRIAAMTEIANEKSLDPKCSREARLELVASAEKDPAMAGHALDVMLWRLAVLKDLGRDADYVRTAEAACATTNVSEEIAVRLALAGFYRARAARFYDDPDAETLKKAEACYGKVIELRAPLGRVNIDESIARQGIADCRYARKDYDGCRAMLAEMKEKGYVSRPRDISVMMEKLGDCAYAEEKWQEAVEAYGVSGDKMTDVSRMLRYAGALVALDRKAEAITVVEAASKFGGSQSKTKCQNLLKKLKER